MIFAVTPRGLRAVLQTDHARLCGHFAAAWGADPYRAPEPLAAVRLAADLHDEGWLEWERAPRVQHGAGRPIDFMRLPTEDHTELYRRGIRIATEADPYAGLLVSLHGTGLYLRRYGYMEHLTFPEVPPASRELVERFLSEQEALQARLHSELKPDEEALWTHYRWLQGWDLLSLYVCLREQSGADPFLLGIMPCYPGGPETMMRVQGAGPGLFRVSPWPFTASTLTLELPVRYVPNRSYPSDQAFQEAFAMAPLETVTFTLVP